MSSDRLRGKKALVTGAANGIGRETALAFAAEGASVLATDIDFEGLTSLSQQAPRVETNALDVTDRTAIEVLFRSAEYDVIFNCAGWVHDGAILDCEEGAWQRSFAVNIESMYRICRAAIPGMIARGGGSIVNMSSVASSIKGIRNRFAYGTTKAAVIGLTKSIAADYVQQRIRCNAICPGTVRTPSLEARIGAMEGSRDKNWQSFIDRQPMGRLGEPHEIAALAVYLASDESSFTTGSAYVIDGGWTG